MLTEEQTNAIAKCIEAGGGTKFAFADAPLCSAIDSIIEHLETTQMETSLFGIALTDDGVAQDPETAENRFVHHAMHWAFQLGVGAALFAAGQDFAAGDVDIDGES